MTVCISAFSDNSRAIVLVADKALTYGSDTSNPSQGESDISKIVPIGKSGWNALIAGSPGIADQILRRAAEKIDKDPQISTSDIMMAACIQQTYQEHRSEFIENSILKPKQISKQLLYSRSKDLLPLPEKFFDEVTEEINNFKLNCDMLICGFDYRKRPHIFSMRDPGMVMVHDLEGQASIGIGSQIAIIELQEWEVSRKDKIEEVLYSLLSLLAAKARSERILMVGPGWDAVVMTIVKGKPRSFPVKRAIRNLIDSVFNTSMRSPFLKHKELPKDWKSKLSYYAKSIKKKSAKK